VPLSQPVSEEIQGRKKGVHTTPSIPFPDIATPYYESVFVKEFDESWVDQSIPVSLLVKDGNERNDDKPLEI
jgi:hypothetical protein